MKHFDIEVMPSFFSFAACCLVWQYGLMAWDKMGKVPFMGSHCQKKYYTGGPWYLQCHDWWFDYPKNDQFCDFSLVIRNF